MLQREPWAVAFHSIDRTPLADSAFRAEGSEGPSLRTYRFMRPTHQDRRRSSVLQLALASPELRRYHCGDLTDSAHSAAGMPAFSQLAALVLLASGSAAVAAQAANATVQSSAGASFGKATSTSQSVTSSGRAEATSSASTAAATAAAETDVAKAPSVSLQQQYIMAVSISW